MAKRIIGPPPLGHVVAEYKIGNTRIKICDDYCAKSEAEVQAILDRIGTNVYKNMCATQQA